jgi:DNA-binding NtrC family response regulator
MPGMSGIDLLAILKERSPETVKILMTGHADLSTALEAINIGEVFRFIVIPRENEALIRMVHEGVDHYCLVKAMRSRDVATILSLAQAIDLKDP